jgi:hypothetical protein
LRHANEWGVWICKDYSGKPGSPDSLIGIVVRLRGGSGFRSPSGAEILLFFVSSVGSKINLACIRYRCSFPGIEWPGREVDRLISILVSRLKKELS